MLFNGIAKFDKHFNSLLDNFTIVFMVLSCAKNIYHLYDISPHATKSLALLSPQCVGNFTRAYK